MLNDDIFIKEYLKIILEDDAQKGKKQETLKRDVLLVPSLQVSNNKALSAYFGSNNLENLDINEKPIKCDITKVKEYANNLWQLLTDALQNGAGGSNDSKKGEDGEENGEGEDGEENGDGEDGEGGEETGEGENNITATAEAPKSEDEKSGDDNNKES